jgi:hypothetical protein
MGDSGRPPSKESGWWYRKYSPRDTVLEELEKAAREERKGLWADPQPVPPWEWICPPLPVAVYPRRYRLLVTPEVAIHLSGFSLQFLQRDVVRSIFSVPPGQAFSYST